MARKPPPAKKPTPRPRRAASAEDREEDRVRNWFSKVRAADKRYEEWEKQFEVKRCEDYFEGRQWYGLPEANASKLYVINLTLASIETQKPSLLFFKPQIRVEPRPSRADQVGKPTLDAEAKLSQQAVQTYIDDPDVKFMLETSLGIQDAHFRFAIVEVGYTADFIDNPHAGKPVLPTKPDEAGEMPEDEDAGETTDTDVDDATATAAEATGGPVGPAKLIRPGTERIYVKRIPSKHFRVSLSGKNDLTANDFVCYYEWQYVSDLKANKKYANTESLKPTGTIDAKYRDSSTTKDAEAKHGMVKVWKVWDLRAKVKHVLADGHDTFLLEDEPWKVFPFADLKFIERLDEYYPLPVVYNWISPQDELNEQREQAKTHRRRFDRKFTYVTGAIDETEVTKIQNGGDGVFGKANKENPIQAVPDAPLGSDAWRAGVQAETDFTMVSGVSGEQRQVATADTATQANIMDSRARLRESAARVKVADWIGQIARLMLLNLREHMALPFVIKTQLDAQTATPEEVLKTAMLWKAIGNKELGEVDMDITVDLESMSPVTQDVQRTAWNQVLALLANPAIAMMLTQSEVLLRKTLALYGIHSESEIQEIKKVAEAGVMMQQMALMSKMGGMPSMVSAGGGSTAQPAPPSPQQLTAQVAGIQ